MCLVIITVVCLSVLGGLASELGSAVPAILLKVVPERILVRALGPTRGLALVDLPPDDGHSVGVASPLSSELLAKHAESMGVQDHELNSSTVWTK
jgi:hypothetical protein